MIEPTEASGRKVIQLATMPEGRYQMQGGVSVRAALYALCNDGTMWAMDDHGRWKAVRSVPDPWDSVDYTEGIAP